MKGFRLSIAQHLLPIHVVFYHSLRLAPRCPASTLVYLAIPYRANVWLLVSWRGALNGGIKRCTIVEWPLIVYIANSMTIHNYNNNHMFQLSIGSVVLSLTCTLGWYQLHRNCLQWTHNTFTHVVEVVQMCKIIQDEKGKGQEFAPGPQCKGGAQTVPDLFK